MAFWSRLLGLSDGVTPNANGPADYTPGDPDGIELTGGEDDVHTRSLPGVSPSPWSGWPSSWSVPGWDQPGITKLIDTAWSCLDLNSSVLASMPVYRLQSGRIVESPSWMTNPDPSIYTSWAEFAKQLFWDYQMGEAFVLPTSTYADGRPMTFRVIPPWLIKVEMRAGLREYKLGSLDVTAEILHIRYQSTTVDAHGHGPLEAAGARITAAGLLQRYAQQLAETGGVPHYWLQHEKALPPDQAADLLDQWVASRSRHPGHPGVMSGPVTLNSMPTMNAKDLALLELSQFNEGRIAIALGVPPFLAGLPSGGDSMTYSNVSQLFDFHDRSSLRPKALAVMSALSGWALPRGQSCELNRDEYSRPGMLERATAYEKMIPLGVLSADEARAMERFHGETSAVSLTGGDDT